MKRITIIKRTTVYLAVLLVLCCSVLLTSTQAHALEIIYGTEEEEETESATEAAGAEEVLGGVHIDDSVSTGQVSYTVEGIGHAGVSIDYSSVVRVNQNAQTTGGGQGQTVHTVGSSAWPSVIWLYLRTQGFSPAAAAAVLGNMERDSNFDPNMSGENGRGLFSLSAEEYSAVLNYCTLTGKNCGKVLDQTEAVIESLASYAFERYTGKEMVYDLLSETELTDGNHDDEPYCIYWYEAMTLEEFKKLEDPAAASEIWRRVMVRNEASSADIELRRQMTINYYDYLKDVSFTGADIILEAVRYVGNPYVYGGDDLNNGIDCSHFICKILTLTNHYSGCYLYSGAIRGLGTEVGDLSNAQPGDVLCWDGHVAFYVAPGTIVHARSEAYGITLDSGIDLQHNLGGLVTIRRVL